MVLPAPRIEGVLPDLLEFVGDAVIVGHNVRYDLGFLNAALERSGRPPASPTRGRHVRAGPPAGARRGAELPAVHAGRPLPPAPPPDATAPSTTRWPPATCCTCCSSGRPASACSASTTCSPCPPSPATRRSAKLRLTDHLPRRPGVYLFRDARRPDALRRQGDEPAQPGAVVLLRRRPAQGRPAAPREAQRIDHVVCASPLEAAVLEVRLIHRFEPRFNRQAKRWRSVRLPEAHRRTVPAAVGGADAPRRRRHSTSARSRPPAPRSGWPRPSRPRVPLRRCTGTAGQPSSAAGRAHRPSSAWPPARAPARSPRASTRVVVAQRAPRGLTVDPAAPARPARSGEWTRWPPRSASRRRPTCATGPRRWRRRSAGSADSTVSGGPAGWSSRCPGERGAELVRGRLVRSWAIDGHGESAEVPLPLDLDPAAPDGAPGQRCPARPPILDNAALPRGAGRRAGLRRRVARQGGAGLRLLHSDGGLASAFPALPSFEPARRSAAAQPPVGRRR